MDLQNKRNVRVREGSEIWKKGIVLGKYYKKPITKVDDQGELREDEEFKKDLF